MAAATFTFDETLHLYRDANGIVLPSVTQVLKAEGMISFDGIPEHILERKRRLGTLVHKAAELYDNETIEGFEIPDEVQDYLLGYINFRKDCGFTPTLIEHRMVAEYYGMKYGMTLDRTGAIDGVDHVIELKCGAAEDPAWGVQLAAYSVGRAGGNRRPTLQRAVVQLGSQFPRAYKVWSYEDPADYQVWVSSLSNTLWKQNKGKFSVDAVPERLVA